MAISSAGLCVRLGCYCFGSDVGVRIVFVIILVLEFVLVFVWVSGWSVGGGCVRNRVGVGFE